MRPLSTFSYHRGRQPASAVDLLPLSISVCCLWRHSLLSLKNFHFVEEVGGLESCHRWQSVSLIQCDCSQCEYFVSLGFKSYSSFEQGWDLRTLQRVHYLVLSHLTLSHHLGPSASHDHQRRNLATDHRLALSAVASEDHYRGKSIQSWGQSSQQRCSHWGSIGLYHRLASRWSKGLMPLGGHSPVEKQIVGQCYRVVPPHFTETEGEATVSLRSTPLG